MGVLWENSHWHSLIPSSGMEFHKQPQSQWWLLLGTRMCFMSAHHCDPSVDPSCSQPGSLLVKGSS